ncbi:hypothetical protein ZIOFF_063418 [Zingiber officinale]|uniref:Uncharacterized protein n=1 Tax=Zingiber officinale TaxID=94328 RepID=A0A8J5F6B8_ZINOF|nr:hypothetical protein ZIOFF_063418 [Zingiber officinale]
MFKLRTQLCADPNGIHSHQLAYYYYCYFFPNSVQFDCRKRNPGPMYYNGVYHLFYQYNPNGSVWGHIIWAHSVSTDLINWEALEPAIYPTIPSDINGCWSGSATILPDNRPVIMYTGIDLQNRQVQNVAYPKNLSDPYLREWVKPDYNPVIAPGSGMDASAFRDPTTAWRGGGHWKLVVGSKWNKKGEAILYRSRDFVRWIKAKHSLHAARDTGMWECPDFYPVALRGQRGLDTSAAGGSDVKHILKVSLALTRYEYYTIGTYDHVKDKYVPDGTSPDDHTGLRYDYGNFYASKTFFDPKKNRRILWGWANESDTVDDDGAKGWAGIQAIPRTIWLSRNGRQLMQWPIEELESLRSKHIIVQNTQVPSGGFFEVQGIDSSQVDVEVTFEVTGLEKAEAFDSSWTPNAEALCGQKTANVRGGAGPFGLHVLASANTEERTSVFFRIFKAQTKYKVLMCHDLTRQVPLFLWWFVCTIEELESLRSKHIVVQNTQVSSGGFFEVQGIDSSQVDVELTFEVTGLEKAEAFDPSWTTNVEALCGQKRANVRGGARPFGLHVLALANMEERTSVFFRIFKAQTKYKIDHSVVEIFGAGGTTCITSRVYPSTAIGRNAHLFVFNNGLANIDHSVVESFGAGGDDMHYIQSLFQHSHQKKCSSICVQQWISQCESIKARSMGDEEALHEWSMRLHSSWFVCTIEELESLRSKHIIVQNTKVPSGGFFEVQGIYYSQVDEELTFEVTRLEKSEAFDPSWTTNAQALCGQKRANVRGGAGPLGLYVLASANMEERTSVFFRIFKAQTKYKIDHSVVESFGAGGDDMHYIQSLFQHSHRKKCSSICVQQWISQCESIKARSMGDEEALHEWSMRLHSSWFVCTIEELESLSSKHFVVQNTKVPGGGFFEVQGIYYSQVDVELAFEVTGLEKSEAFDPSWTTNAQALCGQKRANVRGRAGPFGLYVLASANMEERTSVFFRIFKAQTKYKIDHSVVESFGAGGDDMHYIPSLFQHSHQKKCSSICVQQWISQCESIKARSMGDEEALHEWSMRLHSSWFVCTIEELESLRSKHIVVQNMKVPSGGFFEVQGIYYSQVDVELTFEVTRLEKSEAFDPSWTTNAQALCGQKRANVRGGAGPFGLHVLASANMEERTSVFFGIFKAQTKYKIDHSVVESFGAGGDDMHYIQSLFQHSHQKKCSSICVQQWISQCESIKARSMGDEEALHEWSMRLHSS